MTEIVIFHTVCEWGRNSVSTHTVYTDEGVARRMFTHLVAIDGKKISIGLLKFSDISMYDYDRDENIAYCVQRSSDHDRWIDEGYEY